MNVDVFIRILVTLGEAVGSAGDTATRSEFAELSRRLEPHADEPIAIGKKLTLSIRSSLARQDSCMGFASALRHLKFFRRAAEDVGRRADLNAIDAVIEGLGQDQVARKPPTRKPKAPIVPSESRRARDYLGQLTAASGNRDQGEQALASLEGDREIGVAEMNWLAQQYSGGSTIYPSRPKALERIRSRFETVARRERKSTEIRRLTEVSQ